MTKQEAIDYIMDNFDFRMAWNMMQHNDNFWIHKQEDNSEATLRSWCRGQMHTLSKSLPNYKTGGFQFEYQTEGNHHFMRLTFIGTSWDNY